MGRRKSELILLMEVASKWPWKVSGVLVPVSYLVCHLIAVAFAHVVAPANTADLGPVVIRQGIHAFASILQYILPLGVATTAVARGACLARARAHSTNCVDARFIWAN